MPYTVPFGPLTAEPDPAGGLLTHPGEDPLAYDDDSPCTLPFERPTPWEASKALLDEALEIAESLGFLVVLLPRGGPSGHDWMRGRKRLFLDSSRTVQERLALTADALRDDQRLACVAMSASLARYLAPRRAA